MGERAPSPPPATRLTSCSPSNCPLRNPPHTGSNEASLCSANSTTNNLFLPFPTFFLECFEDELVKIHCLRYILGQMRNILNKLSGSCHNFSQKFENNIFQLRERIE